MKIYDKIKENIMEVADEIYSNGNRENIERYTEHGQNINGGNNESNRYDGTSPKTSKLSTREQRQQRNNENGILTKTQSRNNRELDNNYISVYSYLKLHKKGTTLNEGVKSRNISSSSANNIPQSEKNSND